MCRNHDFEYLQDAANKLKTKLDEKASLLESKQREIRVALAEYNTFQRNLPKAKDHRISTFKTAAEAEAWQQDITKKLSHDTAELFKTSTQLQQAIDEINQVKESEDVYMVTSKFDLVEKAQNMGQIKPKLEFDEDERAILESYDLLDEDSVSEDPGIYKLRGRVSFLEFRFQTLDLINVESERLLEIDVSNILSYQYTLFSVI